MTVFVSSDDFDGILMITKGADDIILPRIDRNSPHYNLYMKIQTGIL